MGHWQSLPETLASGDEVLFLGGVYGRDSVRNAVSHAGDNALHRGLPGSVDSAQPDLRDGDELRRNRLRPRDPVGSQQHLPHGLTALLGRNPSRREREPDQLSSFI